LSRGFRTAATMGVLIGILVGLAYFGWQGLTRGWFDDSQATAEDVPAEACSTPPPVTVRAQQVRVSVYNAGAPSGQAGAVMDALSRQGFREGRLTDAPDRITVDGIVLWPGDADRGAVELVERQFRDVRVVARPEPLGPGINVLVGDEFGRLAPQAPRSIDVPQPEVCGQQG
jgi:LytR cell envelope-related transcriptional attenuator